MSRRTPGARVGVLINQGGTVLAPGIVLGSFGNWVTVGVFDERQRPATVRTIVEYVESVLFEETVALFAPQWEALERVSWVNFENETKAYDEAEDLLKRLGHIPSSE